LELVTSSVEIFNVSQAIDILISGTLNFTGVYSVAKFVWRLICNFEKYGQLINYFNQARISTNQSDKLYYWGKTLGTLFNIIGTSMVFKKK
jgi:hypothetical protein